MTGCDMIANLTKLPREQEYESFRIKRVFVGEKPRVLAFIRENFSEG